MTAKSVRQQFADTMLAIGKSDAELVVLVGDISHGILQPFATACPGRYYNIGILEPSMMSIGAGLARVGLYPVVHTIAPFLVERAFEQIKLDFCYQGLHGNIVTVGSAFDYSYLGCTHHCYGDFALLKTLEGTEIVYPGSALEFDVLFRNSYRNGSVTFFRVPGANHGIKLDSEEIIFGKGILLRRGRDVTIVATGPQLRSAIEAAKLLEMGGLEAEVIYLNTVRPLDDEIIAASVLKTRRVAVVEEHMRSGGLGDDVLRLIQKLGNIEFLSISIPDKFVRSYGSYEDHCETFGLTPRGVYSLVSQAFKF